MEISNVLSQVAQQSQSTAISSIKQAAKSDQAIADMVSSVAANGQRGLNLDIRV